MNTGSRLAEGVLGLEAQPNTPHAPPARPTPPMDLLDALYGCRSVRSYTGAPVPRSVIEALADAAVQAPSPLNGQPWAFAVFQGRELLRNFSDRARLHFLQTFSPGSDPNGRMREALADPAYNIFYDAETLVVVLEKPVAGSFATGACFIAAHNLILAAHAMGLGTCPVSFVQPWMDLGDVKTELGIPETYSVVLPVIVGYPAGTPHKPARSQPEFVTWK